MKQILTINGGSSGIKFARFEEGGTLRRLLTGQVARIGLPDSVVQIRDAVTNQKTSTPIDAPNHTAAVNVWLQWLEENVDIGALAEVGHRVVHGRRCKTEIAWTLGPRPG